MSKTVELARHLSTLNINNMYKNDFYWTWDKTDDEIDAVFTVADALRDLRERNQMRDVLFFEVNTDDPVEWVRREIKGGEVHLTAEEGRPGEMTVFVESAGMYQKFLFTEL